MRRNNSNNYTKTLIIVGALVVCTYIIFATYKGIQSIKKSQEVAEVVAPIEIIPKVRFATIDIEAQSAIVYDINTGGVLFSKNENERRPLASVTKIMTIFAADKLLKDVSSVTISPLAISTYGEYGMYPNETWNRKELQDYTLITSANDGAVALAEAAGETITDSYDSTAKVDAFIIYMNNLAKEIGLTSTSFQNPSGLDTDDVSSTPQAYGSASDIAKLLSYIMIQNPDVLEASSEKKRLFNAAGKRYTADNTNDIVGTIPSLIASKTGYTDAAGGNLAVVYDSGLNRPVTIIVLGSSKEGRFADMARLIEHTQEYFEKMNAPAETIGVVENK
jgi:D-alanyl-D-alanine carboxypeptidase (penicillin-binding protein 5/6)